ncbi:MAG: carboxypeptidase-like regulatory domain-containing protein [Bacillota bacterium]|jgi:hypothetical protein|nr:carboxypeptidase-like regulatory domain-containing protein [Bacillota bacterium]NLH87469.1 carboxypeptidase regulatory-like domain-containing protein [Bacillota bacterium]HAN86041.1 hypothetical protein [Bacillota bacterium]
MKRALLATALVIMCVVLSGCTLYFGGWATAGGRVVERVDGVPVPGATVSLKSVSNPDYGLNCVTDQKGYWATPVKLKCDMYDVTVSKNGYVEVGPFGFPMPKRGAHYTMETIEMEKPQEKPDK